MKIDEKLDHGPILSQFREDITLTDTTENLRERLFERAGKVLTTLIPALLLGKVKSVKQHHARATYTREIKKADAFIEPGFLDSVMHGNSLQSSWNIPFIKNFEIKPTPETTQRFIRAMQPWPSAWTFITGTAAETKRLAIHKARIENEKLVLEKVQLEGKNSVSWDQFTHGYPKAKFI